MVRSPQFQRASRSRFGVLPLVAFLLAAVPAAAAFAVGNATKSLTAADSTDSVNVYLGS
ncbi:hypothetical protein [Cryobacterium glaciale]|uniref:hypothetical protein n=1 Tax=Cryobacterium glaciale TaxID=1259145 RepID=UPI00141AC7DF|nr:hypothetical protein [Cryobacterium glaciale]